MPDQPEPGGAPRPTIQIGTIFNVLPPQVQDSIIRLLNTQTDDLRLVKELKVLLQPYQAELDKVGILADYFAYMLLHVRNQLGGQ